MVEGKTGKTFAKESEERKQLAESRKLSQEEQELVNAAAYLVPVYEQMKEKDLIDGEININTIVLTATRIGIDSMVSHAIQHGFMEDPRVEAASKAGYINELERRDKEEHEELLSEDDIVLAHADAEEVVAAAEAEAKAVEDLDAAQEFYEGAREGMLAAEEATEGVPDLPEPSEAMQEGLLCQGVDNDTK